MTSLALFPQLRRTLTDVMEDELYHVPAITNSQSTPQQQQSQASAIQNTPNLSSIMSNYHLNNSNNSLSNNNYKSSPTLSHSKLFRNPSALNSEEMLTIPEHPHHTSHQQQHQSHQLQNQELSRIPSHDMYYDIPEPLPLDEDRHIFNEFADPNLTTTNHVYRSEQNYNNNHPQQPQQTAELHHPGSQAPAKLLKFNDDLSLDYFTNEDDSKFVIYPVMSPTMIPEEIEDEEISDDDDDDYDNELTYLDNTIDDSRNPLSYQHQKFQAQQEQIQKNEVQLTQQQEQLQHKQQQLQQQQKQQQQQQVQSQSPPPQQQHVQQVVVKEEEDDVTQDLESDIDRMSLDSSDDEYSSNSSVMDDDSYAPTFTTQSNLTPPKDVKPKKRSMSASAPITANVSTNQQTPSVGLNTLNNSNNHQCHLINPSTNQPCLKQFSRPYDLIRHQETIHASRKKIFRCVVCNKLEGGLSNKTFSRGDALSRHIRVKHGLTGKEATDALQYAKDHVEYV